MQNIVKYPFLLIFLFSLLFHGSYKIGSYSVRNYMTIVFLLVSFIIQKKEKMLKDNLVNTFIVYIVVLLFCNFVNGELLSARFVQTIIVFMMPSVVVLYGMPKFLQTKNDIIFIFSLLTAFYLINIFITLGQYVGNDIAWYISNIIGFETPDDAEEFKLASYLPGMLSNVVRNGYFIASFLPIVTVSVLSKKIPHQIIGLFILFLATICAFVVQQRMSFLFILFYILFLAFVKQNRLLVSLIIVTLVYLTIQGISFDTGRLNINTENGDRMSLFAKFINFISTEDVVFGGYENYLQKYGGYQHNSFTSVVVLGGIPSLIAFSVLFYRMLKKIVRFILVSMNTQPIICSLCITCFIYAFYGMTHSTGIQNDGLYFWLSYSIVIATQRIEKL